MKTALVAGATGLIGSHLVQLLIKDENFSAVTSLVRKPTGLQHSNLKEVVVDYDKPETLSAAISTKDTLFCCLGTIMKNAGSKDAFYKVDYTYITTLAEAAKQKGVKQMLVISSAGASTKSMFFYSRVKGETENKLMTIGFEQLVIFRPSLLMGYRKEHRSGEKFVQDIAKAINPLLIGSLKRYRGIEAETVAKAMINYSLNNEKGNIIVESDKIQEAGLPH